MSNLKSSYMVLSLLAISLTSALLSGAQQEKRDSPMTQKQMDEMNMRGDKHMGFSESINKIRTLVVSVFRRRYL